MRMDKVNHKLRALMSFVVFGWTKINIICIWVGGRELALCVWEEMRWKWQRIVMDTNLYGAVDGYSRKALNIYGARLDRCVTEFVFQMIRIEFTFQIIYIGIDIFIIGVCPSFALKIKMWYMKIKHRHKFIEFLIKLCVLWKLII